MLTLIVILAAVLTSIYLRMPTTTEDQVRPENIEKTNGDTFHQIAWSAAVEHIGIPFAQYCVSLTYALYMRFTIINVSIFILKYVPTGYYMYKFIKDFYLKSRERIKLKKMEMEDIQLQIQIVNRKLGVRNAEFTERAEQLRRSTERLRKVRARVRDVIAADDTLRRALKNATQWNTDNDETWQPPPEEDREFIVELLKEFKFDNLSLPERSPEKMDCGEPAHSEANTPENSVYSSLSDTDVRPDCRVKIVKVTNVYKVAYLKHYIKQKRLRRATKQALLEKKMENIKSLLEYWQKILNMVLNSKLTKLNIDPHPIDVASQEAMGDYSKPRESIDSDSDMRHSGSDMCYDEYNLNWSQNPYKPYGYNYEDTSIPDSTVSRELCESQDYSYGKYSASPLYCDCGRSPNMTSIVEETNSQIVFAETKSEADDEDECRDLIVL